MTGVPWFTCFTNFRIHKKSCAMSLNIYKCKLAFYVFTAMDMFDWS